MTEQKPESVNERVKIISSAHSLSARRIVGAVGEKDWKKAITFLHTSSTVFSGLGENIKAADDFSLLAFCYNATSEHAKAVEAADKAVELYADPEYSNPELIEPIVQAKRRKAIAHAHLDQFDEAIEIHQELRDLREHQKKEVDQKAEEANIRNLKGKRNTLNFLKKIK